MTETNWDRFFIELARFYSKKSKDPSTKVGSVIVDKNNVVQGLGWNGFPRGVKDLKERYENREQKLLFTCHAEFNAILNANNCLEGCRIYTWPLFTCNECAKAIIQKGIKEVISLPPKEERFKSQYDIAKQMYEESGVMVRIVEADSI